MFNCIGNKLKRLAKIQTKVVISIGIIAFIIGFFMFVGNADCLEYATVYGGSSYYSLESSGNTAYIGMMAMIWGVIAPLLSWIGSFFTYAFGELIEKVTEIAENKV